MSAQPFILILGMHRSGTSCLTGCMEACGLHSGDVSRNGTFNARGDRESNRVRALHDQILGLNLGSWHTPPERIRIPSVLIRRMKFIVDALSVPDRPAGIKDPRSLLLTDAWKRVIGSRCRFVGSFRHPMAVAESLSKRDGLSTKRGLDLWRRYNLELVRQHRKNPFPLVEYDLDSHEQYCSNVLAVASKSGLSPNAGLVKAFVESDLQHHAAAARYVPDSCRALYDYLQFHSENRNEVPMPKWLAGSEQTNQLFVIASQMPPNSEFGNAPNRSSNKRKSA